MIEPREQNSFSIRWRLVHACNYACPGCSAPRVEANCVLARDRLLRMAQKLLALPAAKFAISLSGGEVALHPLLPDLTRYLLRSPRNLELTIESNGSQELKYYLALAANARAGALRFLFNAHPACANPQRLLALISALAERGLPVSVKLFAGEVAPRVAATWLQAMRNLAKSAPFHIFGADGKALALPDEQIVLLAEDALSDKYEAGIVGEGGAPSSASPHEEDDALPEQEGIAGVCDGETAVCGSFCGIGADILHIEPDGRFYGAFCAQAPANPPLWQDGVWPWQARGIVHCQLEACEYASLHPHFADFASARAWRQSLAPVETPGSAARKRMQAGLAATYEREEAALPPRLPAGRETECSVIILVDDSAADLARCIDSALVQDIAALQIIVLDMTGGKNAAAQEYVERYPQIVRLCRVAAGKSLGCALNLGMSLATGRHIAFVNGADMLAHDFLANGIAALARASAQVAVFALCQLGKQDVQYVLSSDVHASPLALPLCFSQNWGGASLLGMLFKTDFLYDCNARFLQSDIAPALGVILPALAFGAVCVKAETGCFRAAGERGEAAWAGISKALDFAEEFCAEFRLDAELPALIADWLYANFLAGHRLPFASAPASSTLPGQHILQKLLKNLAQNAPAKHFSPANADFEAFAVTPPPIL